MRKSAGILLFRKAGGEREVFLVHPGGPYWKGKETGAWSIPKGEFGDGEDPLAAAKREFREETGHNITGDFMALEPVKQKGGKMVYAWAVEGELDPATVVSNTFRQEYPYKSGRWIVVPEVDKAGWFSLEKAGALINSAQLQLVKQLEAILDLDNGL